MAASFNTQLWATLADLDEYGPPVEALNSISHASKKRALRAASGILASYVRSRYALPLAVNVDETEETGLAAGSVAVTGTATEAVSLSIKVDAPGGAVGSSIPILSNEDASTVYPTSTTLASNGVFEYSGLTLTFNGTLSAGDIITVRAGVDYAIRQHVVNIAVYNLLINRGVDPSKGPGQEMVLRYQAALDWARDLQSEKAKLDEGSDATPDKRETGIRFGGQKTPWEWLDKKC